MACEVTNIKIKPCDATWEIEEQTLVKTVADVASSLQSASFKFHAPGNIKKYVWYNVAGGGVDPAHAGYTGHVVAIAANATAAAVATATQVVIDALPDFVATVSGDEVTITNAAVGEATDTVDVDTDFTFTKCQEGGSVDLGFLDGDIEVSTEEQMFEVTAHQSGTDIRSLLRQGQSVEVSLTLKESDHEKLKAMLGAGGSAYTPMAGTELYGWGSSKQGHNAIVDAKRLILHPVANLAANYADDICFWKAYPQVESITISGENPQLMSITFRMFRDDSKDSAINLFAVGDWTQVVP